MILLSCVIPSGYFFSPPERSEGSRISVIARPKVEAISAFVISTEEANSRRAERSLDSPAMAGSLEMTQSIFVISNFRHCETKGRSNLCFCHLERVKRVERSLHSVDEEFSNKKSRVAVCKPGSDPSSEGSTIQLLDTSEHDIEFLVGLWIRLVVCDRLEIIGDDPIGDFDSVICYGEAVPIYYA